MTTTPALAQAWLDPKLFGRTRSVPPPASTWLLVLAADWQTQYQANFVEQGYRLGRAQTATTVRRKDSQVIVTDGPFVEGGEVVGGYSVVDVPDLDVALRIARAFPACPTVELRPVLD